MNADPIWLPCAALVLVTAVVWIKLYVDRLGEMRRRSVSAPSLATARDVTGRRENAAASDNFRNLFEVPVLFYVFCLALVSSGGATPGLVIAAWAYLGLRALHSLIHVTYNRVTHRFAAYVASALLVFGMSAVFVRGLLACARAIASTAARQRRCYRSRRPCRATASSSCSTPWTTSRTTCRRRDRSACSSITTRSTRSSTCRSTRRSPRR